MIWAVAGWVAPVHMPLLNQRNYSSLLLMLIHHSSYLISEIILHQRLLPECLKHSYRLFVHDSSEMRYFNPPQINKVEFHYAESWKLNM